jgi:hypothetical protein
MPGKTLLLTTGDSHSDVKEVSTWVPRETVGQGVHLCGPGAMQTPEKLQTSRATI